MDNPYYRDQSRMFFVTLVCALAGTGQRFSMLDAAAAVASPDILDQALRSTSDARARRSIEAQMAQLGPKAGATSWTGRGPSSPSTSTRTSSTRSRTRASPMP